MPSRWHDAAPTFPRAVGDVGGPPRRCGRRAARNVVQAGGLGPAGPAAAGGNVAAPRPREVRIAAAQRGHRGRLPTFPQAYAGRWPAFGSSGRPTAPWGGARAPSGPSMPMEMWTEHTKGLTPGHLSLSINSELRVAPALRRAFSFPGSRMTQPGILARHLAGFFMSSSRADGSGNRRRARGSPPGSWRGGTGHSSPCRRSSCALVGQRSEAAETPPQVVSPRKRGSAAADLARALCSCFVLTMAAHKHTRTLRDLIRAGLHLVVTCDGCRRESVFAPAELAAFVGTETPISRIPWRCRGCFQSKVVLSFRDAGVLPRQRRPPEPL